MSRRWSIAGQLLALQLGIIAIVLVGVGAVTLAQAEIDFRQTAGGRVLSAAENLAARDLVRQALVAPDLRARQQQAAPNANAVQELSGLSFVMIVDADGTVLADTEDPARVGATLPPESSTAAGGRAWVGDRTDDGPRAVVAHVPVFGEDEPQVGRVIGVAVVGQEYPTLLENLRSAVPNLLTYLGLSAAVGIAGSLLVARRVKRQTLGLEPLEIRGLAEHREAMLTGIKEGVLALDPDDRVALVNAEAHRMLRLPRDCVGRSLTELGIEARLLDVLTGRDGGQDAVVFVGDRILTLNRMPVAVRGVRPAPSPRCVTSPSCDSCTRSSASPGRPRRRSGLRPTSSPTACTPSRGCWSSASTRRCSATSSGSARRPRS
jgi:two-component system, CitB family, sensor kinase